MNSENRTQKTIKKKRRRKKRYLLRFIIFILLCTGAYFLLHIDYFTITAITVAGNKDLSDAEIIKLSEIETGENIFDIHPLMAERRIKKNLYIEDINVKRKLPNRVDMIVTERTGKAQFVRNKKFVVTDNDGMVLEISDKERVATLVEDVKVEKARMGKTIKVDETDTVKFNKAMKLIVSTETSDMYFKRININGDSVEAYVYDGLVCRGLYKDVLQSIESGALKTVVFDLYQKGTESGFINIGSNNYCSFTPQ